MLPLQHSAFVILLVFTGIINCQDIRWRWLAGSSKGNQDPPPDHPGSRSGGAVFVSKNDADNSQFYAFGGLQYDPKKKENVLMNDLWMNEKDPHDPNAGVWTLVHPGSVGKKSHRNRDVPPPRQLAAACGYTDLMVIIYGGFGEGGAALGDTWVFHIKEKKWEQLFVSKVQNGNTSIAVDTPHPRFDMASWCTKESLFVFGGLDSSHTIHNDMWVFSLKDFKWTETNLSKRQFAIADMKNLYYPSARNGAVTWVGTRSNRGLLFLFAGNGLNSTDRHLHINTGYLSDVWSYNISVDVWTHVAGTQEKGQPGNYRIKGRFAKVNNPGCRRAAASFLDTSGNLWLFGGEGADTNKDSVSVFKPSRLLADLWLFDTKRKEWAFMGGRDKGDVSGKYKQISTKDSGSVPGSRCEMTFAVQGNSLIIYGGVGHDEENRDGLLSDFWEVDCHNYVVYSNTIYPATIFMIIFLSLGFTCLASASFMYIRKFYNGPTKGVKKGYEAEYAPLTADTD